MSLGRSRRTDGVVGMWKPLGALLAVSGVVLALGVGSAQAGKTATSVSGTIAVQSGTGLAPTAGTPAFAYGSSVGFNTSVSGPIGSKDSVYVTVVCLQGGTVVYQWSASPSFAFPLVDQAGDGLSWNGQPATCSGSLVWKHVTGSSFTVTYLAQAPFAVTS